MFERYNEKARRVIFFARYEASQYGSREIETEHFLLGTMREGRALMRQLIDPDLDFDQIRAEIEKGMVRGEILPRSAEVPLSQESKNVLQFAFEEAEKQGNQYVGIEHFLLGILRTEGSVAARILQKLGAQLATLRESVANLSADMKSRANDKAVAGLQSFLSRIRSNDTAEAIPMFARYAHVVDSTGNQCKNRKEIEKTFHRSFAPYAMNNVASLIENIDDGPGQTIVASVLWKNITADGDPSMSIHRMTVMLVREGETWQVFFLQVTPVAADNPRSHNLPVN